MATPATKDSLSSYATFGALLHYLRRSARLSQRELAIAVGYGESMISRLEHDERPPDVATIHALFVPALGLEKQTETVARLIELARAAPGEKVEKRRRAPADGKRPSFPTRHRLPARLTSFIGRTEAELAVIELLTQARLVTLTGPGGAGRRAWRSKRHAELPKGKCGGAVTMRVHRCNLMPFTW